MLNNDNDNDNDFRRRVTNIEYENNYIDSNDDCVLQIIVGAIIGFIIAIIVL